MLNMVWRKNMKSEEICKICEEPFEDCVCEKDELDTFYDEIYDEEEDSE